LDVVGITNQKALISVNGESVYFLTMNEDGEAHALSTALTVPTDGDNWHHRLQRISALDVHLFWVDSSDNVLRGRRIDPTGLTPSFNGSAVTIAADVAESNGNRSTVPLCTAHIAAGLCIVLYYSFVDNAAYIRLVNLTSATVGAAVEYSDLPPGTGGRNFDYIACNGVDAARIIYSAGLVSASTAYYIDVTIAGSVLTPGSVLEIDVLLSSTMLTFINGTYYGAGQGLLGSGETLVFGSGAASKVLGLSLSKGVDTFAWITTWQADERLMARQIALATLTDILTMDLGACTESELDLFTYIAYPYVPALDDAVCFFYGRLNNPLGLGLAHVTLTPDNGAGLAVVVSDWGDAFCGALTDDYGYIMAAQCVANLTKLFTGTVADGLTVQTTANIAGYVYPQGFLYSWFYDSVFLISGVAGSIMVQRTQYPFTKWANLTFDHPTSNGMKALAVLS